MRVLLAALFVFACLLVAVIFLGEFLENASLPLVFLVSCGLATLFASLCILGTLLFNPLSGTTPVSIEQLVEDLEVRGLLDDTYFVAVRAFEVSEFEDEGRHLFLELENGSVLYLNGQYLYEYEENTESGKLIPFPCTDFTVRRHREERWVVDIVCRGHFLKPEITIPVEEAISRMNQEMSDGDIITDRSYDAIKASLLQGD